MLQLGWHHGYNTLVPTVQTVEAGVFILLRLKQFEEELNMSIQIPRGTQDILPGTVELWQYIEGQAREICRRYNYKEIRTPILSTLSYFYAVLVIRQISYKRNVLIPRSWRA